MGVTFKKIRNLASGVSRRVSGAAQSQHEKMDNIQPRQVRHNSNRFKRRRKSGPREHLENALDRRQVVVTEQKVVTVETTVSVYVALDGNGVAIATSTLLPAASSFAIPAQLAPSSSPIIVPAAVISALPTAIVSMAAPTVRIPAEVLETTAAPLSAVDSFINSLIPIPTPEVATPTSIIPDTVISNSLVSGAAAVMPPAAAAAATEEPAAVANTTAPSPSTTVAPLIDSLPNTLNTTTNSTLTSSSVFSSLLASNLSTALLNATYSATLLPSTLFSTDSTSATFASSTPDSTPSLAAAGARATSGPSSSGGSNNQAANSGNNDANGAATDPTPPPVIAGAVTGSVGAAAIFIVLLWFFLRWYKRRTNGSIALGGTRSLDHLDAAGTRSDPAMTEHSRFLPAAAASFINRHRYRASSPALPSTEPGFQKVAGRKMPSQFGMDLADAPMAHDFEAERQQRHRSMFADAIALRESQLDNPNARFAYDPEVPAERETFRPSPARTPVIHTGPNPFFGPEEVPSLPSSPQSATFDNVALRHSRSTRFAEGLTIL